MKSLASIHGLTPTVAKRLAAALVDRDILTEATVEKSMISGRWRRQINRPDRRCLIACQHVASALLDAGQWSVDAVRACQHIPVQNVQALHDIMWRGSRRMEGQTVATTKSATKSTTVKCQCGHSEGVHRPRERGMQAHCSTCKGAKALHEYGVKVATPAAAEPKAVPAPKRAATKVATVAHPSTEEVDAYTAKRKTVQDTIKRSQQPVKPAAKGRKDETLCSARGCSEPHIRRGLCRRHYRAALAETAA